jgi:hypothetical protein
MHALIYKTDFNNLGLYLEFAAVMVAALPFLPRLET